MDMILRNCGKHYGQPRQSGDNHCAKCAYFDRLRNAPEFAGYRAGLQRDGTPYIALLGEPVGSADTPR